MKEKAGTSSIAEADSEMEIPTQDATAEEPGRGDLGDNAQVLPYSTVVEEIQGNPAMEKPTAVTTTHEDVVVTAERQNSVPKTSTTLEKINS